MTCMVSIDLVEEVIERQLRKYKNKIVDKHQSGGNFQKAYIENDYMGKRGYPDHPDKEIRYQTHVSGRMPVCRWSFWDNNFFLYSAMRRQTKSTWYSKRKGNTYGLIEPEH